MKQITTAAGFRRLLINAVVVPLGLMLVVAALLVWQIERLEVASSWVEHSDQVIAQANELQKLTLDLETGMRGYLLTSEPRFLEPYNWALAVIDHQSQQLNDAISDNPGQQAVLARIISKRAGWMDYASKQIFRHQHDEDYEQNARLSDGKAMMDSIRADFKTFIGNEESLRNGRSRQTRRASQLTLLLTGVAVLFVGGVLAFLSRSQFIALTRSYETALRVANDLNISLENRVEERTRELEYRSAQLLEANQELEAFGYSISHDLRAPMRHISGFMDLVRKSGAQFGPENDELLKTVADTARLAGKMVDDLLSFSRVGRAPLRLMPVELNPLIEQCRRDIAPDAVGREIDWIIAKLPAVQGDSALLKMALQNLISNAVKYSSQTAKARIEIGTVLNKSPNDNRQDAPGQQNITFFMSDNGTGFDMQYASKLFGVFQRLHRAEEFEGTGIGLANVRRIILRHGGRIWAESHLGQGATFYFTLPVAIKSET